MTLYALSNRALPMAPTRFGIAHPKATRPLAMPAPQWHPPAPRPRMLLRKLLLTLVMMAGFGWGGYRNIHAANMFHGPYGQFDNPLALVEGGVQPFEPPQNAAGYLDNPQRSEWGDYLSLPEDGSPNPAAQKERAQMADMDALRARFNTLAQPYYQHPGQGIAPLSSALNLLNNVLPYRSALAQRDPEALARHDALIARFVNHPQVRFVYVDSDLQAYEMDPATRYLIAANLLDLMHNRWDLIEDQLIGLNPPLYVIQAEGMEKNFHPENRTASVVGYFSPGTNDMFFDAFSGLWGPVADKQPATLVLHEFGHGTDANRIAVPWLGISLPSGHMMGLDETDRQTIDQEYQRLQTLLMIQIERANAGQFAQVGQALEDGSLSHSEIGALDFLTSEELARVKEAAHGKLTPEAWEAFRQEFFRARQYANPKVSHVLGIGTYAFSLSNWETQTLGIRTEFVPEITGYFFAKPQVLFEASPRLYDVWMRYYRVDPLRGYRDLDPQEAAIVMSPARFPPEKPAKSPR